MVTTSVTEHRDQEQLPVVEEPVQIEARDKFVLRGGTHFVMYTGAAAGQGSKCFVAIGSKPAH